MPVEEVTDTTRTNKKFFVESRVCNETVDVEFGRDEDGAEKYCVTFKKENPKVEVLLDYVDVDELTRACAAMAVLSGR